VYTKGQHPLY